MTLSGLKDTITVNPVSQDGGPLIPRNIKGTAYDLNILDVDDILPSPLTPLVVPPLVPELVYEKQTAVFFTMARAYPQGNSLWIWPLMPG